MLTKGLIKNIGFQVVVAMLLGFFFLIRSLFANWLGLSLGIASISNSANIGLFGLCWAVSALCVAVMLSRLASDVV